MSALTSIFNFLYVYFCFFVKLSFGGHFSSFSFTVAEQQQYARQLVFNISNGLVQNAVNLSGEPLVILIIGVFTLGAIIGLVRRLMR